MRSGGKLAAGVIVGAVVGFVPASAHAHGHSLAQGILLALVLVGLASLAVLTAMLAGIVALVRLRRSPDSTRRRVAARRLGWANMALGLIALTGSVPAMLQSADGWKLGLVGLGLVAMGSVLLGMSSSKQQRSGDL